MASVCLYFQIHQPYRLRRYSVFDTDRHYFDPHRNGEIVRRASQACYLPANRLLLDLIRRHAGRFRVSFSLTGAALEQLAAHAPDVVDTFHQLNETGCVEFLAETYHHSLAFLYSRDEFRAQVDLHRALMKKLFNQEPRVFRNTELIYNNDLAQFVSHMGYRAVLGGGAGAAPGARGPNVVYRPPHAPRLKLLLRDDRLSEDVAVSADGRASGEWPLTAEKFARGVKSIDGNGSLCNLFVDYETFGRSHAPDAGAFEFLRQLPGEILKNPGHDFLTPGQVVDRYDAAGEVDVPHMVSWADPERDLSVWLGNAMQTNALHELYKLEGPLKEKGDEQLLTDWRRITASDHFYYMCTKYWADGDAHPPLSPYESPYDGYINFMNVLDNVRERIKE